MWCLCVDTKCACGDPSCAFVFDCVCVLHESVGVHIDLFAMRFGFLEEQCANGGL